MAQERKAKLFRNGGSQAVRLPADFRFDGDEVYISRDEVTGDVTLSARPRRDVWKDYIDYRGTLDIPLDEADDFMADRPMNRPVRRPGIFEDEAQ